MDTSALKKFAQSARRDLVAQVSTRLDVVLAVNSDERRDQPAAVTALEAAIKKSDREQVIEKAAYTWFNRFCALTFMDRNNYNAVHVVTPGEDGIRPAILSEALGGQVDEAVPDKDRARIRALLDRTAPSREPELEAYKILLASACQQWHRRMPYMFGRIEDWTELLMPGDLLAETSVLNEMRAVMTEETCEDVEVIGWLYQFYISEKKDEVFAALKKNVKITAANIPAATQLFTPHWIVRYLVENSLGRLWLLNKPNSNLATQMEYYIAPEEAEIDFLKVSKPEEIKICDPAVGSGHMLTYAFDLLYTIYEEEGYSPDDIPGLILTHNLTGIEIDDRAGALAAFALAMKAASKLGRRKFLQLDLQPNICVLQNISFTESELEDVAYVVGKNLFTDALKETLNQFEQALNLGSLITPKLCDPSKVLREVEAEEFSDTFQIKDVKGRVAKVLRMSEALSPKYHVVVANPPYMGGKGMNGKLGAWVKENYPDVKSDLFSAFIIRNTVLALPKAQLGFMTPFVWMFISSFEKLRLYLLKKKAITSLVQLEYSGFDGATVPVCTFTIENSHRPTLRGSYIRLADFKGADIQGEKALEAIQNKKSTWFHQASANDFGKVPGSPIAYWISSRERNLYDGGNLLSKSAYPRKGMDTGENATFLRLWYETSADKITSFGGSKWYPYNKGGEFRRWYGNKEWVVNWENNGEEIKSRLSWKSKKPTIRNPDFFLREGFAWTTISSGGFSARYTTSDSLFDNGGCTLFADTGLRKIGSFMNSVVMSRYLEFLSPTLNFQPGDIGTSLYLPECEDLDINTTELIDASKEDWDASETSWDFTSLPLLSNVYRGKNLEDSYNNIRTHWNNMTDRMHAFEEENNRIFIDAYGLQNELKPDVERKKVTLTCNPQYRYSRSKDWDYDDYEEALWEDTIKEFLSYAVGCMFGRYSLDAPGLILANQGETLQDYLAKVPNLTFEPDDDNVIPILEGDWFSDDITQRFRDFLRLTFGEDHFVENLEFIEEALGRDIRKYFLKDFYGDHVKRYKKRPIYWQFSSPKGHFNALIYMHRYRSDTVSIVLNDYLRDFKAKLQAHIKSLEAITIDPSTSDREKTKAGKDIDKARKALHDIETYESEILFPLAEQQIEIDLDDGVKQNYPKFGKALKKVTGLSAK